jgi:hypothetical protein
MYGRVLYIFCWNRMVVSLLSLFVRTVFNWDAGVRDRGSRGKGLRALASRPCEQGELMDERRCRHRLRRRYRRRYRRRCRRRCRRRSRRHRCRHRRYRHYNRRRCYCCCNYQ